MGVRRKRSPSGVQYHSHPAGRLSRGASPQAEGEARPAQVALPRAGDCQELAGNFLAAERRLELSHIVKRGSPDAPVPLS